MKNLNKCIALVGYRKSAYKAAKKLFSSVQVLVPTGTKLPKSIDNIIYFNEASSQNLSLHTIPELCLPLTESSVTVSSTLVQKYNCEGYGEELSQFSHEKMQLKKQAFNKNLNISKYQLITGSTEAKTLIKDLGLPLVIKQQNSSGSRGLFVCNTLEDVQRHISVGKIAESFIYGFEFSAEVFVKNKKKVFTNYTNYYRHQKINLVPHIFSNSLEKKVNAFIDQVLSAYQVQTAFLHIEFFITNDEQIILGEFAIRPPGGYIMSLIELSYGFNPWETYIKLFSQQQLEPLPSVPNSYSCVVIMHPGEGQVESVVGVEQVKKLKSFHSIKIKKQMGDQVSTRMGSGQDVGYVILVNKNKKALLEDLKSLELKLKINLVNTELAPR